ncbi:MAG: hypothetical protein IPJ65_12350 [Archangiaceae bacterium]|nr:hypothetical protein [Archangiaceae bacterium]
MWSTPPPSRLPHILRLLPVCLLVTLTACPSDDGGATLTPLPPESVARLVSKEGTVTLTRSGKPAPAQPGALYEHDELETGAAAKALLRAPGGREIELGENTRFKVGRDLGDIEVTEGTISFLAPGEGDGGVTQVTTRFGRTAIAPGTRATLALGAAGLAVDVSVGVITQVEEDGGTRTASAGQKLEFGVGSIEVVDPGTPKEPPKVQLTADGRVLLKKKGEPRFSAARKGAQDAPEGTAFQVGPGGRARLSFDGAAVKLGAGVNGSIDAAQKGDDGNEVALTVNGPVALALDGKAPVKVKLAGKHPIEVKGKSEAAANVSRGRVEVLAGELELVVNGKPQVVKAGEVASVSATGAVEVAARARPWLTVPLGKKVRVYAKRAVGEIGLQLPEELSRAQVANDAAFTDLVLAGPGKDFITVNAPAAGELFWRTVDDQGEAQSNGRVRFMPDVGSAKDEASRGDVVAETGLKATVFFQGAVPTLTFTFPSVEGAKGYRFRVYRASDLNKALVDKKTNEAKTTVDPGLLTEGSYRWSASALDEAGNDKVGGRMNQMDIIYDNSLTTLQLASPRDGDRLDGAKCSGTAPLGTRLFLNGKPVATDGSGRFNVAAPKAELLVFRLVSGDGSESYWLRRLRK